MRTQIPPDILIEEALEAIVTLVKQELPMVLSSMSSTPGKTAATSSKGRKAARDLGLRHTSTATNAATMTLVLERLPGLATLGITDALVHQLIQISLSAIFTMALATR